MIKSGLKLRRTRSKGPFWINVYEENGRELYSYPHTDMTWASQAGGQTKTLKYRLRIELKSLTNVYAWRKSRR